MADLSLLELMLQVVERRQARLDLGRALSSVPLSDAELDPTLLPSEVSLLVEGFGRHIQHLSATELQQLRIRLCQSAMRQLDRVFDDASV